MSILKFIGASILFFIIKQFLKLIVNVGQRQMPTTNAPDSTTQKNSDNVIEATFTRKE